MTATLLLRGVASVDYVRRQAVARWQREGHPVRLSQPSPQTRYIAFRAQGCHGSWQGMIGACEWLQAVGPQWSQWLYQEGAGQQVLDLFSAVSRPVEIAPDLLDYQRLFECRLIPGEALQAAVLPCISTPQGDLWVMEGPSQRKAPSRLLQAWLQALPLALRIVLGNSELARLPSRQLARGDVLVIAEQTRQLFMADVCIGRFTFVKEGLHMELTIPDNPLPSKPCVLPELPVKLEFVLGELTLSMAALNELIECQVLPLEATAASNVEVRVGGMCIAVGELVRLGDRLGVELREVGRGMGNE
ncbi:MULTISPECIES: FliM/FliN family flagellar motor switch protein [unclassified Pseudomonas]|uniref:FliM/FliN family flagellar motor switch protein n=1 Tax=unclassified Pseudomonas TaxID=196821 RepID=UPI000A1E864B|nr:MULTISPECIES: FliM/FliN family flagellar motor switch protein [unclassified Pseudomonas]